jgi:hypothetical protein
MSVVRQLKKPLRRAHSTDDILLVFRFFDLLVRIRILGSVFLTNGSGSELESCSFRAYKKNFNTKFLQKIINLSLKIMCLRVSYKKKI